MSNYITKYCIIRNNKVIINNRIDYVQENFTNFTNFIKSLYKNYQIKYPKFFKMDNLNKLSFITAELLFKKNNFISSYNNEDIGVVIANSHSSLDTDIKYYDTIKDKSNYFPNPSLFVYTLPNILLGEICIRNKIKGENAFFIFEKFDTGFICKYVNNLLDTNKIQSCITGWIDFNDDDDYESVLYLIEKRKINNDNIIFEPKNFKKNLGLFQSFV